MKKCIITLLIIFALCTTVFASTLPNTIRKYKENNNTYMVKDYEVTDGTRNEEHESEESTNEYKTTSSQGATNKATHSTKEKNNVSI